MSTIRVDNFGPSAGGTTYSARGIAKAWVNFNGTGTIAARDSENVSSLTDNGTGDYTVNLTSSMANANYCVGLSATDNGTTGGQTDGFSYGSWARGSSSTGYATGSMRFQIGYPAAITLYDQTHVNLSLHGDLA